MIAALTLVGCDLMRPAPSPVPGGPPTLAELETQVVGGTCVFVNGQRYAPGDARRVLRHPEENCRIHAAQAIKALGPAGSAATPSLLDALSHAADIDTGDGWLMVRTATLGALAAVADDPIAIPALRDATRSTGHRVGRVAAAKARALGHDPTHDLAQAAAALTGPHPLEALRELAAYDDPRADPALSEALDAEPRDGRVWMLALDRSAKSPPIRAALRAACARPPQSTPSWHRDHACRHAR